MNHRLYISFYSPIHIGDGQELEPFEYIIKDNYLYTFSLDRFVASLNEEERQKLIQLQRNMKPSSLKDIRNFIKHRISPDLFRDKIAVTSAVAKIYEEKFFDIQNMLKMETFIRTMGQPYIPGSSFKGSLRTALLNYWVEENHRDEHDILRAKREDRKGRWRPAIELDVFKYLKVPDIPLPENFTLFAKISNFHLKDGELEETNIQLLREVTQSNFFSKGSNLGDTRFHFDLQLNEEMMKDKKSVTGRDDFTFDVLWESLNFYEKILNQESEKWSPSNRSLAQFYENFGEYLKLQKEKSEVKLIKIGFGSGFEAVTITKLRDNQRQHGKSVNLVEGISPLGWAILHKEAE